MDRLFLIHYHTFKNAGTSLDRVFQRHFGTRWVEVEFPGQHDGSSAALVQNWVEEHADRYDMLSTHTGLPPVPGREGLECLGIMLLRFPLDRIRSAYEFEIRQNADTFGAELAKDHDFRGYVQTRLDRVNDFALENFQVRRLCNRGAGKNHLEENFEAAIPDATQMFLGLVESFEETMRRLQKRIGAAHPDFAWTPIRENVSRASVSMEDKLADIRRELGPELFQRLCRANHEDFVIFSRVAADYGREDLAEMALRCADADGVSAA